MWANISRHKNIQNHINTSIDCARCSNLYNHTPTVGVSSFKYKFKMNKYNK